MPMQNPMMMNGGGMGQAYPTGMGMMGMQPPQITGGMSVNPFNFNTNSGMVGGQMNPMMMQQQQQQMQ